MKKILISSPLSDVLLEIKPLEQDSEGLLRGGFAGLSGDATNMTNSASNCHCSNKSICYNVNCSNDSCDNDCNNDGTCTNSVCSNRPTVSASTSGSGLQTVISSLFI